MPARPRFDPYPLLRAVGITVLCIWSLIPIGLIVLNSIRPQIDVFRGTFTSFTFENYATLFRLYPDYLTTMGNSLIVAVGATVLAVVTASLAGFVYSRQRGKFFAASAFFAIAIRLLPPIVVSLPLFPAADFLRLSDTHLLLVVIYATMWTSMLSIMMKTFIDQTPTSLDESARVDGAGTLRILWRVILPLAISGMASGAIFVFVFSWNEFLFAFLFTTRNAVTAPIVLSNIMDSVSGTDWGILFAAATVQLVPILVLVILVQRLLVSGLTAGSVKG
jgi:multiple sugar transport system permease protein